MKGRILVLEIVIGPVPEELGIDLCDACALSVIEKETIDLAPPKAAELDPQILRRRTDALFNIQRLLNSGSFTANAIRDFIHAGLEDV